MADHAPEDTARELQERRAAIEERVDEIRGAWPELARLALRHSVRGLICQPIRLDGMVKGTFNLYV